MMKSIKSFRLSTDIVPVNYDLFFEVDMETFNFIGKETIGIEISRPSSEIVLHATDMKIGDVVLFFNNKKLKPKVRFENDKERLTLTFNEKIKGPAKLQIKFSAKLNDNLLGFHRNKYVKDGKEKYLATTQFEAPYARRAFPCFDEPELKATFDVTLKISKNLQAISNMPIKKETIDGSKRIITFQRTPRMSTYLLYMGVGEFEFLEDRLGKISIRIVTMLGKKNQARFALDMTKKCLQYFEKYSGIPYPLPKLDMIALPDFASGAMENWGAVTFRELYLLFDPKMTSVAVKKRIAMIIAHELWHQWSGNLVTMRWWNDLWLNESFATYMAYKAVDHFFPEWKVWEDFINSETDHAFDEDSLKTTHPIEVEVKDPHQIEEIFDAISYSKGGSVLRMLESYLGEETFRKGISSYLSAYKYGNATSQDLWNHLARASKKPIKDVAASWVNQAGYPIVEAMMNYNKLVLQQRRFVFNYKDKTTWMIPLIIKTNDKQIIELLGKAKKEIPLAADWFKINYGQTGFYRVKYPEDNLAKLENLVSRNILDPSDRWGVQNDLFKLCRNGEITLDRYLDFIKAYSREDSYLVLSSIYSSMRSIYFAFSMENFWKGVWPKFKNIQKENSKEILNKLGWAPRSGEIQKDTLLRELAIRYLGFAEDPEVLRTVEEKFNGYLKNLVELHPDIKSPIFLITAARGNEKVYGKMLDLYLKTQIPEEKRALLMALGQFKDPKLIERFLELSLTDKVRRQDIVIVVASVAANPHSREVLFKWVKKNWKKLESYKKSGRIFLHVIEYFISSYVTKDDENQLRKFFKSHPVHYKMTVSRSFERLRRRVTWREKNKKILAKYFRNQ